MGESWPTKKDNRYLPRWNVENEVIFKKEGSADYQEGQSKDISAEGACIKTKAEFLPYKNIRLSIFFTEKDFVDLTGNILWSKVQGDEHLVGIQFKNVSVKDQEKILSHAFELNPQKLKEHWFKGTK